jgi:hypothetical protein
MSNTGSRLKSLEKAMAAGDPKTNLHAMRALRLWPAQLLMEEY